MSFDPFIDAMARAFASGEQSVPEFVERGERTLGGPRHWLPRLAKQYVERYPERERVRPRHRDVVGFIREFAPPRHTAQGKPTRRLRVRSTRRRAPHAARRGTSSRRYSTAFPPTTMLRTDS
jgi:hypothetical protein